MRFRYLCDPLFLVCLVAYFVNRWLIRPAVGNGFWHSHFNDFICIAFWVPIMLTGMRLLHLRRHDDPPLPSEILVPLLLWSVVFEVLLPSSVHFRAVSYADPQDVVWYVAGALGAALVWRLTYGLPSRIDQATDAAQRSTTSDRGRR